MRATTSMMIGALVNCRQVEEFSPIGQSGAQRGIWSH